MTWADALPHALPGPGDFPGLTVDEGCCEDGCVRCEPWDDDDLGGES